MKLEYREPNRNHKHKQPKTKSYKYLRTSVLGLALISITNVGLIWNNYHKSLDWSTNRDSLKMANMPVDTLNDSTSQVKAKENFLVLVNSAMSKDGSISVNHKLLVKLQKALAKIKTAKPLYQRKYDKIAEKYDIEVELNSLFKNKKTLKSSSTPQHVQKVLQEIAPKLNSIYQKNNNDGFVKSKLPMIHYLTQDTNSINNTLTKINNLTYVNNDILTPHADLTPLTYQNAIKPFDKLHYHWPCLNKYKALYDELNGILSQQEDKLNIYKSYEADQQAKKNSYAEWAKKREERRNDYFKALEEKRKEKERKLEEEAKARKEQEDKNKKDDSNNNDNDESVSKSHASSQNNSRASSKSSSKPSHSGSDTTQSSQNYSQSSNPNNTSRTFKSNNDSSNTSTSNSNQNKPKNDNHPSQNNSSNDNDEYVSGGENDAEIDAR